SFYETRYSLSDAEVNILFKIIDDLKNQGITILYISHKMDEIFKICDKATVLRDGKYVTTFDIKSTSKEELIKSMVGRDVSMFARRKNPSIATEEVVLKVDNLSNTIGYSDVSFQLKKGEILGFFGLIGAQRTEVMRGIFGADPITRGKIYLNGKQIINHSPFDGVKNNIALIPENRKEEGFVKNLCNADNIALACINNFMKGLFLDNGKKEQNAIKYGKAVGLYPNDPEFMTAYLSGGNAQKVILAKWISTNAEVFIFDEPTKGIDIGAKAEIYKLMEEMLEQGKSIIMVSSELTEVIGMSDRLIVMKEGSIVAELQKNELSEETIIALAVGGKN
ncbi:MAG: sugar ABC transporter ATP-binding protein, partial [Christensenellaceae bacterium]